MTTKKDNNLTKDELIAEVERLRKIWNQKD